MTADMSSMPIERLASSLANWLTGRRAEIARRAIASGLPLTVSRQVPVAEFTAGGLQSTAEPRQESLFAAMGSVMNPGLFRSISAPLIDSRGEELAETLVAHFGDGVKYVAMFGPGFIQHDLEHPDLVTQLARSETGSNDPGEQMLAFDPLFYVLLALRQCLVEYLSSLPSLASDDDRLVEHLAGELLTFLGGTQIFHLGRIPLAGLDIEGDSVEVDGCAIQRLTREELGYMFSSRWPARYEPSRVASTLPGTVSPADFLQERVVLEILEGKPKTQWHTVAVSAQKFLLAFHLLGLEFAGTGFGAMLQQPGWLWAGGQSVYPLLMPKRHVQELVIVNAEHLEAARSLATEIPDAAVSGPQSPKDLAIRRLALAMSRDDPGEAVVDYAVCLEALLLGGSDIGEAKKRFALNGAVYGASGQRQRRILYEQLGRVYLARSVLVHGVSPAERRARRVLESIGAIRDQAWEMARLMVRKAIIEGWPTEDTFVHALLDDSLPLAPSEDAG